MKIKASIYSTALFAVITSGTVNAKQTEVMESGLNSLPLSPIVNTQTKQMNDELLSCKVDSPVDNQVTPSQNRNTQKDNFLPQSLEYLNDIVKATYNTMRNGVISYVTRQVALSLLNFNVNGFAAENLASYVSAGTKPYLPFEFANGVKITKVTPQDQRAIANCLNLRTSLS